VIHRYHLLDAARAETPNLREAQRRNPQFLSLYKGQSAQALAEVAPYLFTCERGTAFVRWLLEKGWGKSWGVFCEAEGDLAALERHFRKFLLVQKEGGGQLYFRYYDPRVLRIVLPTFDAGQLDEFFGPVKAYVLEDEDPAYALRYTLQNRRLRTEREELSACGWLK
jgi:hypothetical protein